MADEASYEWVCDQSSASSESYKTSVAFSIIFAVYILGTIVVSATSVYVASRPQTSPTPSEEMLPLMPRSGE